MTGYTVEDVGAARDWMIEFRDNLIDRWPDTTNETVIVSNVIAMLFDLMKAQQ